MEVIPNSAKERESVELAHNNNNVLGLETDKPHKIVIGEPPMYGDGWADPVTRTVFSERANVNIIQHELVHNEQYKQLLGIPDGLPESVRKVESQAKDTARERLGFDFGSPLGFNEFAYMDTVDYFLAAVSEDGTMDRIVKSKDRVEDEHGKVENINNYLERRIALQEFKNEVDEIVDDCNLQDWRSNCPSYAQPLIDSLKSYLNTDLPMAEMEAQATAWELASNLNLRKHPSRTEEIEEELEVMEEFYEDHELYPSGKEVRERTEGIIYSWLDSGADVETLGQSLDRRIRSY